MYVFTKCTQALFVLNRGIQMYILATPFTEISPKTPLLCYPAPPPSLILHLLVYKWLGSLFASVAQAPEFFIRELLHKPYTLQHLCPSNTIAQRFRATTHKPFITHLLYLAATVQCCMVHKTMLGIPSSIPHTQ